MIWLLPALGAAALDWVAVARGYKPAEYVFKPLTILLLLLGALASGAAVPAALVVALVLSMAGDVFLMLPRDRFVPGLVSFLGAHIAYIVLFLPRVSISLTWWLLVVLGVGAGAAVGTRIVRGLSATGRIELIGPVVAYMVVITAMLLAAGATGSAWILGGAGLFYVSDSLIGWNRFVHASAWGPGAIIVTYHLAQIAITTGALQLVA